MADLKDRGQIILIAGFALAVIFIALALVVNSAIFTENLATRGETTGGSDALIERHQVEESVETIIGAVNNRTSATPLTEVNQSVDNLTLQSGIQNAETGRIVTTGVVNNSEYLSARLFQTNISRNFTNADGNQDWQLAENASQVRTVEFNVSADSLENVTEENSTDAFTLELEDNASSDTWSMSVYEPKNENEDVGITVRNGPGPPLGTCLADDSYTTINVTNGSVAGSSCSVLDSTNRTYTGHTGNSVQFENAQDAEGNFSIAVELNDADDIDPSNYDMSASPIADVDIEYLDVTYRHETTRLQYVTNFTVESGGS